MEDWHPIWLVMQDRGPGKPQEFQGVFDEREKAIAASFENCIIYKMRLNEELPRETCDALEYFFPHNQTYAS